MTSALPEISVSLDDLTWLRDHTSDVPWTFSSNAQQVWPTVAKGRSRPADRRLLDGPIPAALNRAVMLARQANAEGKRVRFDPPQRRVVLADGDTPLATLNVRAPARGRRS